MRTLVIGWVAGVLAGCIAEPAQEVGIADLQPQWCDPEADDAEQSCKDACGALTNPVTDCMAGPNEDLAEYFGEVQAAFEQLDPSVAGNVYECIQSFDDFQDDCGALYEGIYDALDDTAGPGVAQFQAIWSVIPCELLVTLVHTMHWPELSCIYQNKWDLLAQAGDSAMLSYQLSRLDDELFWWATNVGGCNVASFVLDRARESCDSIACAGARALAYAQCRGACPAPEGTACVPGGFPAWADCGVWQWRPALDNIGLGSCECAADPDLANPLNNGLCGSYVWESVKPFGTFNRPCDANSRSRFRNGSTGLWTFVVDHDGNGRGIGYTMGCFSNDEIATLENRDSCDHAFDGKCEEGDICDDGTDLTDCRYGQP